jgi:hypothetical protein
VFSLGSKHDELALSDPEINVCKIKHPGDKATFSVLCNGTTDSHKASDYYAIKNWQSFEIELH